MNIIEYAKFKKMFGKGGGSVAPVEGTAIPVGSAPGQIYFNVNNIREETDAYLSQLTYVQTDLFEYPISLICGYLFNEKPVIVYAEQKLTPLGHCYAIYCFVLDSIIELYNSAKNDYVLYNNGFVVEDLDLVQRCSGALVFRLKDDVTVLTDFYGLPLGLENEKIKNVLSITPFGASGTSSNKPTAYAVSSVDELPSDAVEGSMAIVESESTVETWVFKDELDNLGLSYEAWKDDAGNILSPFNIEYSNADLGMAVGELNKVWSSFHITTQGSPSWGIYTLKAIDDASGIMITLYTHNPSGNYGITHGWPVEEYKTINVHYADAEATQWLEAHATSLGKDVAQKLYIRENGEWIYKCEVV